MSPDAPQEPSPPPAEAPPPPTDGPAPGDSSRRRSPEALAEARWEQASRELEGLNAKLSLLQGRVEGLAEAAGASEAAAAEARALMAQLARSQGRSRGWAVGLGVALSISLAALAGVLLGAVAPALNEARSAHQHALAMEAQVAEAKAMAEEAKVQLAQLQPRIDQALRAPLAATAALEGRAKGVLAQAKVSLKQAEAAGLDFPKAKTAYLDARRLFELAASLDPKDPEAPLGLGMALVGLGEVPLAQEAWRRTMELATQAQRQDLYEEALKRLSSLGAFSLPLPRKPGHEGRAAPSRALPGAGPGLPSASSPSASGPASAGLQRPNLPPTRSGAPGPTNR